MISRLFSRWSRATVAILVVSSAIVGVAAHAQEVPETALQRQLNRIDLGLQGVGQFTKTVNGTVTSGPNAPFAQTEEGSNTFGALISLRYTKSPYIGFEGNFGYARYTENFSRVVLGGAQTKVEEYSLGYVAHPPRSFFGFKPYGAAGIGTLAFTPTRYGGQGLPEQARMMYYYNVGVDTPVLTDWFGIRVGFREKFFLAPDFQQNYLTILKHTDTIEPVVGFTFKF